MTIEEKILTPMLEYFMSIEDVKMHIKNSNIKERIETIRGMQIIIYSNDHEPPHFHVKSKDNRVNAKFRIQDCSYMCGEINSKDLQRIKEFHQDIKTQKVMELIWNKRSKSA